MEIQLELDLDHEDSLNDWAVKLADDDIATGYHTNWDHAYECAWQSLDAEYNYEIVRPQEVKDGQSKSMGHGPRREGR